MLQLDKKYWPGVTPKFYNWIVVKKSKNILHIKKKNMKKIIIAVILGVIIFGVSAYLLLRGQASKETNNKIKKDSKTLVVYYSSQGHTDKIAKEIAANLNANIFELVPENEYSSDDLNYNNKNSRVSKEYKAET